MAFKQKLVLTCLLLATGCVVGGETDAGFSIHWSIVDMEGTTVTCEMAGASLVEVTVVDAAGDTFIYEEMCGTGGFETAKWELATGTAWISASLLSDTRVVLATVAKRPKELVSGQLNNDMGTLVFSVTDIVIPEPETYAVTVSWQLVDKDQAPVACDSAGARYIVFDLVDVSGITYEMGPTPCETAGSYTELLSAPIAAGQANLKAMLLNGSMEQVVSADYPIDVAAGEGDLAIEEILIEVVPIEVGGDASITWEWRIDGAYFSDAICQELGIDYITLWVEDNASGERWTDPSVAELPCGAFDHPNDDAVWGDLSYSGLYVADFLPAGTYKLFLGFYARGDASTGNETADVLLHYDSAGLADSEKSGVLMADEATEAGTNHLVTDFETESEDQLGVLKVTLQWLSPADNTLTSCAGAGVADMEYSLTNEDWVASEAAFGSGEGCQDALVFEGLLDTGYPYELLVSGISADESIFWYAVCPDLTIEYVASADEAQGYVCEVLFDQPI